MLIRMEIRDEREEKRAMIQKRKRDHAQLVVLDQEGKRGEGKSKRRALRRKEPFLFGEPGDGGGGGGLIV